MPSTASLVIPTTHPLPVGTHVYYSDLSPWERAVVVANDRTSPAFVAAVKRFNALVPAAHITTADVDYCLTFPDDERSPTDWVPVQRDGIRLPS